MKQLVLKIDDNRYALFLQFLKTLNYVQVIQPEKSNQLENEPKQQYGFSDSEGNEKSHLMADLAGSLAGSDGDELAEIISREFQEIEGEW